MGLGDISYTYFCVFHCFCYNENKNAAMDRKQKERLRFYLKARKRADQVLEKQREIKRKKLDHEKRLETNHELMRQYAEELTALARQSGILSMAERAALQRGGSLVQEVSYYIDYGLNSSNLQHVTGVADKGVLRASHLALRITWEQDGEPNEVEVRVHKTGSITFHNFFLPVFPIIWRWKPRLLQTMFASALQHPRAPSVPAK